MAFPISATHSSCSGQCCSSGTHRAQVGGGVAGILRGDMRTDGAYLRGQLPHKEIPNESNLLSFGQTITENDLQLNPNNLTLTQYSRIPVLTMMQVRMSKRKINLQLLPETK